MSTPAKPSTNLRYEIRFHPGDQEDGARPELMNLLRALPKSEKKDSCQRVEAFLLSLAQKGPFQDPYEDMEIDSREIRLYKFVCRRFMIYYSLEDMTFTIIHSRRVRRHKDEVDGQNVVARRMKGIHLVN